MRIAPTIVFDWISLGTTSIASAQILSELTIKTNASYINDVQCSADAKTFTIARPNLSAGTQGTVAR